MSPQTLRVTLVTLAFVLVSVESQRATSRTFPHNTVTEALPSNLKLDPKLKQVLDLTAPEDFETEVLQKNYKFNDREILLKALLHESYKANVTKTTRDSYHPLDQIGTMVVDYMFTRHLLLNMIKVDGKQLTTMKDAMVRGQTIAFVALKNKFERYMNVDPKILDSKTHKDFKTAVEGHEFFQDIVGKEPDVKKRPSPASFVPKMFKAVIGAIYVDSGYNMELTEKAVLPLFKKELDRVLTKVTVRNQPVV